MDYATIDIYRKRRNRTSYAIALQMKTFALHNRDICGQRNEKETWSTFNT